MNKKELKEYTSMRIRKKTKSAIKKLKNKFFNRDYVTWSEERVILFLLDFYKKHKGEGSD